MRKFMHLHALDLKGLKSVVDSSFPYRGILQPNIYPRDKGCFNTGVYDMHLCKLVSLFSLHRKHNQYTFKIHTIKYASK